MRRLVIPFFLGFTAVVLSQLSPATGQNKKKQPAKVQENKIAEALPESGPAKPKQPRNILLYTRTAGFRHGSIPTGVRAITLMGDRTGAYTAHHTEDESMFEPSKLAKFDAVFMLNTTGDCLLPADKNKQREEELKKSLVDFVKGGKGLIGVHAATDTYRNWPEYNQMMGGAFVSHPWHKLVPVKNLAPDHPVNAAFGGKGFEIADEIYMFRDDTALASGRKYLLALDTDKMSKEDVAKGKRKDGTYPISWVSNFGKGRVFYCSLGHRDEIYWNPEILKHYLAGIQFALGDLEADAKPQK